MKGQQQAQAHPSRHRTQTDITFKIGGKGNVDNGFDAAFTVQATSAELIDIYSYIDRITEIDLYTHQLTNSNAYKSKIKTLATLINELSQLACLFHEKEKIQFAFSCFCQNTIDHMPLNHVKMGNPGSAAYEKQRHDISELIRVMTRALRKAGIIDTTFIFQSPEEGEHHRLTPISSDHLPKGLKAFEQSIHNDILCKTRWEFYLRVFDSETLSDYFAEITGLLQHPSVPREEATRITGLLNSFVLRLKKHPSSLQAVQMMLDVVNQGGDSPMPEPRKASSIRPKVSFFIPPPPPLDISSETRTRRALESQINNLIHATRTFNDDFATFRDDLFNAVESSKIKTKDILEALQYYLESKDTSANNAQTVKKYIDQCVVRCSHHMPIDLLETQETLRLTYQDAQPLSRLHNKSIFLEAWLANIRSYPTKTYAECFQLTKDNISVAAIKSLVIEQKRCSLFSQHRFKDFVTTLIQLEPDYDKTHPKSPVLEELYDEQSQSAVF